MKIEVRYRDYWLTEPTDHSPTWEVIANLDEHDAPALRAVALEFIREIVAGLTAKYGKGKVVQS